LISNCRSQWPRVLRQWVCGRSLAGIAGSNPPGHGCLFLVSVVFCQVQVSGSADCSYTGVLPSVVCLNVIVRP